MSISSSSNSTANSQNHFPEQRIQTIADALGVYLATSFCNSIVQHSGQTLEDLAAQSQASETKSADLVSANEKLTEPAYGREKTYRSNTIKSMGWFIHPALQEPLVTSVIG